MIVAIAIGREGSVGFPGKNVAPVLGRPLMSYPLMAARNARHVDAVFVSTDSPTIARIARWYGADVIERPSALATDAALGEDVFSQAYHGLASDASEEIELIVLLFCNAATVLPGTIDEGVEILRRDPSIDSAATVSRYNMWAPPRARKIGESGLLEPFVPFESWGDATRVTCDRDSQGDVYFVDCSASIVRPVCLEDLSYGTPPQRWMGRRIHPLVQWGGLDVDFAWQIPQVEYWLSAHGFSERTTPYGDKARPEGLSEGATGLSQGAVHV